MEMARVLRPSTASSVQLLFFGRLSADVMNLAEFRGPGVRHQFDDSPDDFDLDLDHRTKGFGGRSGRIILLGDGTEVLTDTDDTEMFDHSEEDKDLDSQVQKNASSSNDDAGRSEREGTPAPEQTAQDTSAASTTPLKISESPSSTNTEQSEPPTKSGSDSAGEQKAGA